MRVHQYTYPNFFLLLFHKYPNSLVVNLISYGKIASIQISLVLGTEYWSTLLGMKT